MAETSDTTDTDSGAADAAADATGNVAAPRTQRARRRERARADERARAAGEATAAGVVVGLLAVINGIFGVVLGVGQRRECAKVYDELGWMEPGDVVDLADGGTATVADVLRSADLAVVIAFAVPLGAAAMFAACMVWSWRSPFPALLTALGLWSLGQVVGMLLAPGTATDAILFRMVVFVTLCRAVHVTRIARENDRAAAATAARDAERARRHCSR